MVTFCNMTIISLMQLSFAYAGGNERNLVRKDILGMQALPLSHG